MADDSWRLPSLVQELAATVQERDRLGGQLAGAEMPEPVPAVDLSRLSASHGAEAGEEAPELRSALHSWGFFRVTNHGMETSLMEAVGRGYRVAGVFPAAA